MKIIYNQLLTLLGQIPELRWIDVDFGQIDSYETRPPIAFPAALIDIELPECSDEGDKIQRCTCRVSLRLVFDTYGETSAAAPAIDRNKATRYFDTVEKVYVKLQGYYDDNIDGLSRKDVFQEKRDDGLKVTVMRFETEFDDFSANTEG